MVDPNSRISAGRYRNIARRTCIEACRADDVSLMEQAISLASRPSSDHTVEDVLQYGLKRSAARNAVHVLQYVLDHGADVKGLDADDLFVNDVYVKPSLEMLEILIAHGWDINALGTRRPSWPLLWYIAPHHDLVTFCLDLGARIDVPDPLGVNADGTENRSNPPRPPLLGIVASSGSVETFELLMGQGAPLAPRTLHRAVEQATILAPWPGSSDGSPYYERRMDMVRHLLDVVKLDVNAVEHKIAYLSSTPLCCVAHRPTTQDFRELIYLLLDRGADPNLGGTTQEGIQWPSPTSYAQSIGNSHFLQLVQEWRASKQGDSAD